MSDPKIDHSGNGSCFAKISTSTSDDVDAVAELALVTVTPEVEPAVRGGTAAEDLGTGVMDRERDPGPGEIPDHLLTERS